MKTRIFGSSYLGLPQIAYEFSNGGPDVLILGGVHGDEIEGVAAADGLLAAFLKSSTYKINLTLIPRFNPDGVLLKTRGNGNGVDLNRNLPTKDWSPEIKTPRYHPGKTPASESENRGLIDLLRANPPKLIISLHSWHPVLNINGDCKPEAEVLASLTGYKIDTDIGYPTPGSLGTFAVESKSACLTYEIQRGQVPNEVLRIHVPALLEALKVTERRFQ